MVRCSAKAIKSTSNIVIGKKKKNVVNHNGGKKNLQKENVAVRTARKVAKEVQNRIHLQRIKQKAFNAKSLAVKAFEWISEEQANCDYLVAEAEHSDFCMVEDLEQYVAEYAITDKSAASKPFATMAELQKVLDYLVKIDVLELNEDNDTYDWTTVDAFKDMVESHIKTKKAMEEWCDEHCDGSGVQEDLMGDFEDSEEEEEDDEDEEEEDDERHQSLDEFENVVYSYLDAMVKKKSVKGASHVFFQFPKEDYQQELAEAVRRFNAGEYIKKKKAPAKKKADDDEDYSMSEDDDEESSSEDEDESDAEDDEEEYTIEVVDKSLQFHNCFHSVHHTCLHEERPELINNGYVVTLLDDQVFKKYVETLSDDIEDAYGLPINVDLYAVLKALKVKHNRKLDPYELEEEHHEYLSNTSVTVRHTINGRAATIEVTDYLEIEEEEEEEDSKDYESMSYREVQRICKRRGFAGNETKAWMIDVLKDNDKVIAEMEDAEF